MLLNLLCIEMVKLDLALIIRWQNPTTGEFLEFYTGSFNIYFSSRYVLFAVINHIGTLDAGHYTSYIRFICILMLETLF